MSTERRVCRGCRREVIAGLSTTGFDVELDPTELDIAAELAAVVAGGATYTRHTWADVIAPRLPHVIRERPAGSRPRQAVHAAHDCARPTPRRIEAAPVDDGGGVDDAPPF